MPKSSTKKAGTTSSEEPPLVSLSAAAAGDVTHGGAANSADTFHCALCMANVKPEDIRDHFKVYHKITKSDAVEKLLVLGATISSEVDLNQAEPPWRKEDTKVEMPSSSFTAAAAVQTGHGLKAGSLVQGHIVGYPWWPAIVDQVEESGETPVSRQLIDNYLSTHFRLFLLNQLFHQNSDFLAVKLGSQTAFRQRQN